MKNVILFLIFFLPGLMVFSQGEKERNVIWIHGLGGSDVSWKTNSAFHQNKYLMRSVSPGYGSGQGVRGSSKKTKDEIEKSLGDKATQPTNIAIGHSFGGLVTRTLEMDNDKANEDANFGGFITVHTANAGALLAQNFNNGVAEKAINNMFNILSTPIKKDQIDDIELQFAEFMDRFNSVDDFLFILHKIFSKTDQDEGFEQLQGLAGLAGFLDPSKIGDLTPGSDILKELNSYDGSAEKITIWGAEEPSILRRMLSSLFVGPGNDALDIVSDENMDKVFGTMWSMYETNADINRIMGTINDFNPLTLVNGNPFHDRARAWKDGSLYIRNGIETDWLISIGAVRWEDRSVTIKEMTPNCKDKLNELELLLEDFHRTGEYKTIKDVANAIASIQSNPNCYINNTTVIRTPVYTPTDGVVNTDSQLAGGGILFENKNCNHFEALNTKVLSDNFISIFRDGANGSTWFQTYLR